MHGRLRDVVIEACYDTDDATGTRSLSRALRVFADNGLEKTIGKVEGVAHVTALEAPSRLYVVLLDPRYDRDYVIAEIEAAVLCHGWPDQTSTAR